MKISQEKLYKEVFSFCKKNGYISKLQRSFKLSEQERFDDKEILKDGLDVLDAVHCVIDKQRTFFFLKEINRYSKNKKILEAGIGTGILSLFASTKATKVTGLELNKKVLQLALKIKNDLVKRGVVVNDKLSFLQRNAILFKSNDKFDVVICENIYTGMFYEKQVEIMNNLRKLLNIGGVVIPSEMLNHAQLCEIESENKIPAKSLLIPAVERNLKFTNKKLSNLLLYNKLNFKENNGSRCKATIEFKIKRSGVANALLLTSDIVMPSKKVIKGSKTFFFNNDIFLSLESPLRFEKGDCVLMTISYKYGSKPEDTVIRLKKISAILK